MLCAYVSFAAIIAALNTKSKAFKGDDPLINYVNR